MGVMDSAVAAFFMGRGDSFSISASEVCFLLGLVGRLGLCERRGLEERVFEVVGGNDEMYCSASEMGPFTITTLRIAAFYC